MTTDVSLEFAPKSPSELQVEVGTLTHFDLYFARRLGSKLKPEVGFHLKTDLWPEFAPKSPSKLQGEVAMFTHFDL